MAPHRKCMGQDQAQDDETISLDELVAQEITKAFSEGAPDLEETVRADPTYDPNNSPDDPNSWRDLNGKVVPPDQLNAPSMGNTAYEQQIHNFRIMMKDPEFAKEATNVQEEWGGNRGDQNRSATRGEKSLDGAEDYDPVFEKKDDDFLGDIKSTGEWTGDTVAQLKKKITTAKDDQEAHQKDGGKADPAITTKLRQMNFAKNAKQGDYKKGK